MLKDRLFRGRKTSSFTLQWHLTNACPFHCQHCYDRSERSLLTLADAFKVLADFQAFCTRRQVAGHISLSGGDPLWYPGFWELYQAIADAWIPLSILGNPIPRTQVERLIAIQMPTYYQVSLEGLPDFNDRIRGRGHFDQVLQFLAVAKELRLRTHVMLTLHDGNQDQVLPLGEQLRGLTHRLSFNRLAQVGEAIGLTVPDKTAYAAFAREYLKARRDNPGLGLKDGLLNIQLQQWGRRLFGGCTGFGCGAAFNFVALLPNGEVHACRKFPSLLGNVAAANLDAIYHSRLAKKYRHGSVACQHCGLRRVCGGCMAVVHGQGGQVFADRDPQCFMS
jgi:selenobiotic family peptide radical SAM maturase